MRENTLKNHFLIATPALNSGFFAGSVTYICEHDEDGAMGIVVNHPLDVRVDEVLDQLSLADAAYPHNEPVFAGGPLHTDRGFVLHSSAAQRWQESIAISSDIQLTTSLDILGDIATNAGPPYNLIALGYAGWAPGQLEAELEENAWLTVPADHHLLFEVPHHKKLDAALRKMGVDLAKLAPYTGHA
ncbi:YqgE/AlgH family protein [Litorivivens sp.]|uniref:YqgE/AlgH family protein n=1 Tax=Litorivivens sp. TaxID=2020868 RepID=UPI003561C140